MVSNLNSPALRHVSYQVSPSRPDVAIPSSPSRLGSLMLIDGHSESLLMARNRVRRWILKNPGKLHRRMSFVLFCSTPRQRFADVL